ncbi:MAG: mechanosensitive ion channel family protein [Thermodesulfobacteriota bacterium]
MILETIYYHNTVRSWLAAVTIYIVVFLFLVIAKKLAYRKLTVWTSQTVSEWDDLIPHLIQRLKLAVIFALSLYAGTAVLTLSEGLHLLIHKLCLVVLLLQSAIWVSYSMSFWLALYRKQQMVINAGAVTTVSAMAFILQVLLWTIILLLILSNLGVNITALITGLGVSGIAMALAVQNVLGDLFSSFSIVLDKPFVIGDFIIVDDYLGTVEKVGIKTTRIRSLSGEQLIFSNTDLLNSRIRNFKRMVERRVAFHLGLVYQTSLAQLEAVPRILREVVEAQSGVRFDRAHFKEYGEYALNFEIVYWVENPDYNFYMDVQQAVNLTIYKRFQIENIRFAYPTQALLHLHPETGV